MRPSSLRTIENFAVVSMAAIALVAMGVAYHAATVHSRYWFDREWAVAVILSFAAYGCWTVAVWCRQDRREQEANQAPPRDRGSDERHH